MRYPTILILIFICYCINFNFSFTIFKSLDNLKSFSSKINFDIKYLTLNKQDEKIINQLKIQVRRELAINKKRDSTLKF